MATLTAAIVPILTPNQATFLDNLKSRYHVLMTRGHKGCLVFFVDKETERFFRSRMGQRKHLSGSRCEAVLGQ